MDNMEDMSDQDGPNTSCRIDHDNSLSHLATNEQPNDETRRLVDGGPLSNHLIDLERQQIHQSQQQRSLFSGTSLNCLETSLEESTGAPASIVFSKRGSQGQQIQSTTHKEAALLAFQPSSERVQTPSHNRVDWYTEVIGGHMVVTNDQGDEMEWDSAKLEQSAHKTQLGRSSHGFSFYPSQGNVQELTPMLDIQTEMCGTANEEPEFQVMTARTVQSSCFEPRFEHEENTLVTVTRDSMSPLLPQPQRSLGTPKAESASKIDFNEAPQGLVSLQEKRNALDFFSPHYRVAQSSQQVPKMQRLLTLEDAAEAQNNDAAKAKLAQALDKSPSTDEEKDEAMQEEATDYADHLYDSDGGSVRQSQLHLRQPQSQLQSFNSEHKNANAAPRFSSNEHYPRTTSHNNLLNSVSNGAQQDSFQSASQFTSLSPQLSTKDAIQSNGSMTHTRSQPNLFFQPFQRIHSVNELESDINRLSSYRDSSQQYQLEHRPSQPQIRTKDELRDSTATALTQMVQNQNQSIMQENGSGSNSSPGMLEESKVSNTGLDLQQNSASISSSFQMPHPEQLQSYEKMVAQIIRDSIQKENRALKQQIMQLQLNEQKRSPFQSKNSKIFSKPNFTLSGRNSAFKYRPGGGFNFQHPMRHVKNQVDRKGAYEIGDYQERSNSRSPARGVVSDRHKRDDHHSKKDAESMEGSEVIEELIEIEESGESHSVENHSGTVRTNLAGGRGSICSVMENDNTSNLYTEEFKYNGGRRSPRDVLSQRFFDQQSFYGFRRDLTRFQKRPEMAYSAFSQGPDNKELEYEDLEALFNYQGDHMTENDEIEAPFYVPSCMDSITRNPNRHSSKLIQKHRNKQREETLTQVNVSQNQELVDAIYKSSTFDLVKQVAESENGNVQRRSRNSFNSVGLAEETKGERQSRGNGVEAHDDSFYRRRDNNSYSSKSCDGGGGRQDISGLRVHGNIDDDDIVNQNSSHDGRSHTNNRSQMQMDLTQSMINEQTSSPNMPAESALLFEEMTRSGPQVEKATQMSDVGKLRKSNDSSVRKLDGPQRFTFFSASSLADDRWICPICLDIYQDAVETPCCHNLFCEACIKDTRCCPLCNMRIVGALRPNIPIRRLTLELSVQCPNQPCSQKVKRCDLERHIENCQYTLVECPNNHVCGEIVRKDLEKHTQHECLFRHVACLLHCGLRLVLNQMDEHIANDCPKSELQCKNTCGQVIERGKMDDHFRVDCPEQVISCPNKGESLFEDGCSAVLRRKEMDQHRMSCAFRRIVCPNNKCSSVIMFKNLETHDERCLFKIVQCDNKCGTRALRQNIQQHRDVCEYQLVRCPYYDLGCKIEILRKDYREHLIDENFNHSIVFIEGQKKKNKEIDDLQTEIASLRKDYDGEMQWMYVEMQMMKAEMKKVLAKESSSGGEQNPFENQNSSFGENQTNSLWKRMANRESQPPGSYPQQRCSFVLGRGGQGDANVGHFGGTRYNQQSMSVNSTSVANNRQSNNFQNNMDRLNQAQLVDISDELEPRASPPSLPMHNTFGSIVNQSSRSGALVPPNESIRPTTRRGRNQLVGRMGDAFEDKSPSNHGIVNHPPRAGNNFDERFDDTSNDYMLGRSSSIQNSVQDNFHDADEHPSHTGLSTINPLTVNDGARHTIDSTDRRSGLISNAMPSMNNAKPPLFRHQMMLRASEPNYLSSQQQNSMSVSRENASELRNSNNIIVHASQERHGGDNSERENPLAYLLASVNASVDTTINNKQQPRQSQNEHQVPRIEESVLDLMERYSAIREDGIQLSTQQKQQLMQRMSIEQDQRAADQRRYRLSATNNVLTSSTGSAVGALRECRIRKVYTPNRMRNSMTAAMSQGQTSAAAGQAVQVNEASALIQATTMANNNNDLDSSNVLYDADFELEEAKENNTSFRGGAHPASANQIPGYSFINP